MSLGPGPIPIPIPIALPTRRCLPCADNTDAPAPPDARPNPPILLPLELLIPIPSPIALPDPHPESSPSSDVRRPPSHPTSPESFGGPIVRFMDSPQNPDARPRTGLAVTSLVLGILGTVCLGPITGLPAVITGHVAYRRSQRQPAIHGGGGLALAGLILGYVSFVVGIAMAAILASMTLPALAKAKGKAVEIKCLNQMKQIGLGLRIYAVDHDDRFPTNFVAMSAELGSPLILTCPGDTRRFPVAAPDWALLKDANISYEFLTPGIPEAEAVGKTVVRCPIHGSTLMGDGSVHAGRLQPGQGAPPKILAE